MDVETLINEFAVVQGRLADACAKAGYTLDGGISWAGITTLGDAYGNTRRVVVIHTDSNENDSYMIPIENFNKEIE